jgi:rubrerythrin
MVVKNRKFAGTLVLMFGAVLVVASVHIAAAAPPEQSAETTESMALSSEKTLAHLMAAYDGESNARAKYRAYASKANEEGYRKVAQLFMAAARSEEIHAELLARTIIELGGNPAVDLKTAVIKSTNENLEDVLMGEGQESESIYPRFLDQATKDNIKGAMIAFGSAIQVEAGHKKMFAEALANLSSWKKSSKGFFVCEICGYTVAVLDFTNCPVCTAPIEKFALIK